MCVCLTLQVFNNMTFIGITAAVDAFIALLTWLAFTLKRPEGLYTRKMKFFSAYLLSTFAFLLFISYTILGVSGSAQAVYLLIADLLLWVSLFVFIDFMYEGTSSRTKPLALVVFGLFAASRTLFQLAGILGMSTAGLGETGNYILSNLDAWLMYAVWLPSAIALMAIALRSSNPLVRLRSLMFAVGLILITFTWAFRILGVTEFTTSAYLLVGWASVVGFSLLLGGMLYRPRVVLGQTQ